MFLINTYFVPSSQAWLLLGFNLCVILFSLVDTATVVSVTDGEIKPACQPVNRSVLMHRMGSSYNKLYMATDHSQVPIDTTDHMSRNDTTGLRRSKRGKKIDISLISDPPPWTCQTTSRWTDLGVDFFPRFIKLTTCATNTCWYGHYSCLPKEFQIKVLKRKSGVCTKVYNWQGRLRFEDYWEIKNFNLILYCECGH